MDSRGRVAHACDRCRRMRTKCSGGLRCAKCEIDGVECVYSDRKREKARKELIESKSSVLDLQAKNERLASLLSGLIAETKIDSDARTQAVQFMEVIRSDTGYLSGRSFVNIS